MSDAHPDGDADDTQPSRAEETVSSRDLLAGRRVLRIRHGEDEYRLQTTRNGKLILTK